MITFYHRSDTTEIPSTECFPRQSLCGDIGEAGAATLASLPRLLARGRDVLQGQGRRDLRSRASSQGVLGEEIEALAKTMASEGQLQQILVKGNPEVRGRWTIVAGERRWRAAKHLGWPRILAAEYGGDAELASLLENLQRVDLNLIEEARGLRRFLDLRGWTQAQAAEALGKRLSDLNGALGVLDLPDEFLDGVLNSEIVLSRNALIELARIPSGGARNRLLGLARAGKLTIPMIRAARVEADLPLPVGGVRDGSTYEAGPAAPAPLSLKVVGNLRAAIRDTREARGLLGNAEREELEQLAEEITELLKLSDRAFS